MQIKVANLPDRSVRYLDSGGGDSSEADGAVVIFLHAFPLSADQWLPQLHRLPPGWRGLAPDLRGFRGGRSMLGYVGPNVTMETYAADVLSFMAHLNVSRAIIAGLSMGGYVAFAMWRRASERIVGLILANTRAGADSADAAAGRDRMIALAEREGPPAVANEMISKLIGASNRRDQPDLEQVVRELIEANATDAIVAALRAMKVRPDSTPLLAQISCPALIISGEEDAVIPAAEMDAMHAAIPRAAARAIPRAGHLSNLEAPHAFNDAIAEFLGRMPVSPQKVR
jgi:pimeloyl-ACP methyl ester carboxylesterase